MNGHKYAFKKNSLHTFLCQHFSNLEVQDFHIDILDNIDNNDKKVRLEKELFWIKLLMTPYPFGFNDQISNYGNISSNIIPFDKASHPYYGLKILRYKQTRKKKTKHHINNNLNLDNSATDLVKRIAEKEGNALHIYHK